MPILNFTVSLSVYTRERTERLSTCGTLMDENLKWCTILLYRISIKQIYILEINVLDSILADRTYT